MSAVARGSLEAIQQQVEAGSISIAIACDRLEGLLSQCLKDELTRPFLNILPDLFIMLFGGARKIGWLGRAVDSTSQRRLIHLLSSEGPIFKAIIYYSELEARPVSFSLPINEVLPLPLQRALESRGPTSLPSPLDACIVKDVKEGERYVTRFDVLEYFIIRLFIIWIEHVRHGEQSTSTSMSHSASIGIVSSSSNIFPRPGSWDSFHLIYLKILRSYLNFFLPLATDHHHPPLVEDNNAFVIRSFSSITRAWKGWRSSCFFWTVLTEVWLHRWDYRLQSDGQVEAGLSDLALTSDYFDVLRLVLQHLLSAILQTKLPSIPTVLHSYYQQLVEIYLYRLLRICLQEHPDAIVVETGGDLWLDLLAPWTLGSSFFPLKDDPLWVEEYLPNNFFFYQTLLAYFLEMALQEAEGVGKTLRHRQSKVITERVVQILLPSFSLLKKILEECHFLFGPLAKIEERELGRPVAAFSQSLRSWQSLPEGGLLEQLAALEGSNAAIPPHLFVDGAEGQILRLIFWSKYIQEKLLRGSTSQVTGARELSSTLIACQKDLQGIFNINDEVYMKFAPGFELGLEQVEKNNTEEETKDKLPLLSNPLEKIRYKKQAAFQESDRRIVKSYESALLVDLFNQLSQSLNETWTNWMKRDYCQRLPSLIQNLRIDLRFLAAWPNLLFLTLSFLLFSILFRIFVL